MNTQEIKRRNKTYQEAQSILFDKLKLTTAQNKTSQEITSLTFYDYLISKSETVEKIKELLGDNFKVDNANGLTSIILKK